MTVPPGMPARMWWWDHRAPESTSSVGRSYMNEFEVQAVLVIARMLLLQGVKPSSITILAPYQGQVRELRKRRLLVSPDSPVAVYLREVDIQTVDMFQGAENDIIILSLTRSNPDGTLGFLQRQNRMCVAMSRARMGLYVVGNADMYDLCNSWKHPIAMFRERRCLHPFMELHCHRHPARRQLVEQPQQALQAPICHEPCNMLMPCNHRCAQTCHVHRDTDTLYAILL